MAMQFTTWRCVRCRKEWEGFIYLRDEEILNLSWQERIDYLGPCYRHPFKAGV